ncbi:hypothetical protein SKAU_G00325840 [Synaphobranchus kaupii]|uniref:G-protein coupled receptors family 1 profile domain-containing protein n=1 Tax=Synaphobranchus kaupii TaxID=118154 RepID=A0A9Q1EPK7_SYNKA|nr:hypothetical protein SKAU_G00325840 [Synaphobranchus kaupii]
MRTERGEQVQLSGVGMLQMNQTTVKEFFIVGFPGLHPDYYELMGAFLFLIYVTTMVGNSLLVMLFFIERRLQKPMYIIMLSLAFSDIGFCTVALPKVIARYWLDDGAIPFQVCLFQAFLIHYFGALNSLIKMTMSLDRFLAICFPLRYPMLMTNRTMGALTAFSWVSVVLYRLSFSLAMLVLLAPLTFIIFSYISIIVAVLKIADAQGRYKAFSTCATQVCIISIYYLPRFFVFLSSTFSFVKGLMAEMENVSYVPLKQPIMFTVEGFIITRQQQYPLFAVTLIVYTVMLLGNVTVFTVITADAKLHKPMYVMICNLAACDLLGGTVVMTQLMSHFLTGDKTIGYVAAIFQAFSVYFYAVAVCTIISAMAYDRYVAICKPLYYHAIMTTGRLVSLCFLTWLIPLSQVTIIFILIVRIPLCGTLIKHVYCSTGAILKLACIPNLVTSLYFFYTSYMITAGSLLIIAFTYVKILIACVVKQEKNSRSKAIQTCASHLSVCILFELTTIIVVAAYKAQGISPNTKKFCAIIPIVVPPTLNPIIYGIATKAIRTNIVKFFKSTVVLK